MIKMSALTKKNTIMIKQYPLCITFDKSSTVYTHVESLKHVLSNIEYFFF